MKQSKSTSNLQLLITELSDSETSNSESITQPNLTRKTADIFNRIKSRHVSSNTLIKQQSIQTQLSKSDMNIEKISTKSTKTPNIQYLISCLDSSTESDVPSTPIHKSKTPQLSHNLAYFLRVRNIEPDLHKITFQKKSRSIGPKKVNSSKISNAFVMELPATPRENLFNIESINCIKEGPIYSKPISNESNNSINYISYSKPPLVNKSDLQLIDNSKISSAVQTSRSSKFREVAEYIENVNSTVYYLRSDSFYAPRTPDGLIVLKIGKKPEWTNFLGIQLRKLNPENHTSNRFQIIGFNPLGVVKYISALEPQNLIGMEIEKINENSLCMFSSIQEAQNFVEAVYQASSVVEIFVRSIN